MKVNKNALLIGTALSFVFSGTVNAVSEDMMMYAAPALAQSSTPSPTPRPTPKPTLKPVARSRPKPMPSHRTSPAPVITAVSGWNTALASEYGGSDGFYYGHFACGGRYIPGSYGVAHKTLPCGTKIEFRFHGRTTTARVVDRGPYCCGRSFDFTIATARQLGLPGIGRVEWRIVK